MSRRWRIERQRIVQRFYLSPPVTAWEPDPHFPQTFATSMEAKRYVLEAWHGDPVFRTSSDAHVRWCWYDLNRIGKRRRTVRCALDDREAQAASLLAFVSRPNPRR